MFGISESETIFILAWCTVPLLIAMGICIYARGSLYLIFACIFMMCVYPTIVLVPFENFWTVAIAYSLIGVLVAFCLWRGFGRYECEATGKSKIREAFFCLFVGVVWWVATPFLALGIAKFSLVVRNMGWDKERLVRKAPEGKPVDWRDVRDEEAE